MENKNVGLIGKYEYISYSAWNGEFKKNMLSI